MLVIKEPQLSWARAILRELKRAGSTYVDDHDILSMRIDGEVFLDSFSQIRFLADAGLVKFDTKPRPGHTCVSITEDGLDWLEIDARGDYSEELVELSILELLKAADEQGNEKVHKGPLEANLRKHHPSLRLLTDNAVLARVRYLVDRRFVEWKPLRGGDKVVTYVCWITAAGQDELRRKPTPPQQPQRPQRPASPTTTGPDLAYVHSLRLEGLACFEEADLEFQYTGRTIPGTQDPSAPPGLENLNLIVGDNGSGKTTILKGIALAVLGGVLPHEGFRSNWFVRANRDSARSTVQLATSAGEETLAVGLARKGPEAEILQHWNSSRTGSEPSDLWFQNGPEYFLCGYGVNSRRAEGDENYDQSLRDKSRGFRYQRVAALFEEGYSLKPISSLFFELTGARNGQPSRHLEEAREILNLLLANTGVSWPGGTQNRTMFFRLPDGLDVPVHSLSDGFRSFLAFIGDLLSNLVEVATTTLRGTAGIVLVDEIDQHLHPKWQRSVLSVLAEVFPKLQFVVTSHSPILVGCLPPENIYVSERDEHGRVRVRPADQDLRKRTVDEILRSPYFQLPSTLEPKLAEERENQIRQRVQLGHEYLRNKTPEAADAYLASLSEKVE
jgi:energy-coupling factor transporter ATP-binding protein EcfA2